MMHQLLLYSTYLPYLSIYLALSLSDQVAASFSSIYLPYLPYLGYLRGRLPWSWQELHDVLRGIFVFQPLPRVQTLRA